MSGYESWKIVNSFLNFNQEISEVRSITGAVSMLEEQ